MSTWLGPAITIVTLGATIIGVWLALRQSMQAAFAAQDEKIDLKLDKVNSRLSALETDMTIIKTALIGQRDPAAG